MRKSIIAAVAAVLSLVLVGAALAAGFTQNSVIKLTAKKAGKSTGFTANVFSVYPGGTKPKAAKQMLVTFPSGTKFNLGKTSACKLSDSQIMGGKSCPGASKVGTGSATAVAWPLGLKVAAGVTAYVSGANSMIVVAKATSPIPQTIVIHEKTSGSKLTIPVPTPTVMGMQVILTSLKLNVPAKGSGKNVLAVAGKCVGGKFTVKSAFTYTDGTKWAGSSSSACTK